MPALLFLIALAQTAKADDTRSVDSIRQAVYEVISGPPGAKHDWDRMRTLFTPDARMIAIGQSREGKPREESFTVEDYIKLSGSMIEKYGFQEKELAHRTEQFGNMAHVFSTYESRYSINGKEHVQRGINSFQLFNDGDGWRILTIYWQDEGPRAKLPAKYLPRG